MHNPTDTDIIIDQLHEIITIQHAIVTTLTEVLKAGTILAERVKQDLDTRGGRGDETH